MISVMSMDAESAVRRILNMSPSIRVVTICGMNGNIVFTARSKRVRNVLSASESRASLKQSSRNMADRRKLARKLGKCKYALAEYEKIKRVVIPAGRSHVIFATCTPAYDHMKIVRKVRSFK